MKIHISFLKESLKSKWAVTAPEGFESKCILAINRFCQFTSPVLKQRKDLFCFKSWNYLWPYPPLWRKNVITSCSLPFDPKTEIWKIEGCKLPWRSKRDEHQKTLLMWKYQILRNSNIRWQTFVCSAGWITGKLFGEYLVENVVADTCLFCRMNGYFKRRLVRPRGQNGRCFVCPDDWVGQAGGQAAWNKWTGL